MLPELPLYPRQLEAAQLFARERGGVAWWRVGEGKTRIALAAFLFYADSLGLPETSQLCVFCRPELYYDWTEEAKALWMDQRLRLMSFASLSGKSAEAIVTDVCRTNAIGMVCFDELYLYKNPDARRSKMAHEISCTKPAIGLSGSIMTAQKIEDVYGQAWAINKHRRISLTMTKFREEYMVGFNEHGGRIFAPKRGAYARLMKDVLDFAHINMPAKSSRTVKDIIHVVPETSQQADMFIEMQETLALYDLNVELKSATALTLKVQQIANGWIKSDDGTINPLSSNKPARCIALCEELVAAGKRVLVFCAFRYDVELLRQASIGKYNYVIMQGGEPFDLPLWQSMAKQPGVCLATEATGTGVNHFAQVEDVIYFSLSQKWLDYQQSRGRIDRKSSEHDTCYYHHILCRNSMDANVLRCVRQAASAEGAMLKLGQTMQGWLNGSEKEVSGLIEN